MNKKIVLALLMALSVSLFLSGCKNKIPEGDNGQQVQKGEIAKDEISNNKQQVQQSKSTQSDAETIDYSKSYASVLDEYRNFVKDYNAHNMESEIFEKEPWSIITPNSIESYEFGYTLKDLNGNGKYELLLIYPYDNIFAIYSLVAGNPKLLDSFWYRYNCDIGKDGFIYRSGSNSAVEHVYEKCTISSDGSEIKVIEKIESKIFDEETGEIITDDNGESAVKYYQSQEDGKKIEISEQKFNELYGKFIEDSRQIELNFISLS